MNLYSDSSNLLNSFLAMGTWQAAVSVIAFFSMIGGFWYFLKKIKIKFVYRVLIGLFLGVIFGIIIQAIANFPKNGLTNPTLDGTTDDNGNPLPNPDYQQWVDQLNTWVSLFKNIFINGIMLITAPVVFIAIFRVTSKVGNKRTTKITFTSVGFLLLNVLVGFVFTFWVGYLIKVGSGISIYGANYDKDMTQTKALPTIIWEYFPSNFANAWVEGAIIPLMVIGALLGNSAKILSKKKSDQIANLKKGMDLAWDLVNSILMTFMRILPLSVAAMITSSLISKPIGALKTIGIILGLGYVGIIFSMLWLIGMIFVFRIKVGKWWKNAWTPLLQGFTTQSSNASLPLAMSVAKERMHINDDIVNVTMPLSTSMGLMGCAGVQSGVITSFLWTATDSTSDVHKLGLIVFFIMALFITLVASLGIAGVPGTAGVVTAGVLSGLGFGAYFAPVYSVVGALDGMFDMGRTGLNVLGGVTTTTIVAKIEGQINSESKLLNEKQLEHQKIIFEKLNNKRVKEEIKQLDKKMDLSKNKDSNEENKKVEN